MSKTNSLHYNLCCIGARWLRGVKRCKYATVELCTYGELTDVWGWYGGESYMIEVKTSHSDFLADKKKWYRRPEAEEYRAGNYRYYLCPKDVIKEEELKDSEWGLLYYDESYSTRGYPYHICQVKAPKYCDIQYKQEIFFLLSIMAREGIKPQIFNYRGQNSTIKPKNDYIISNITGTKTQQTISDGI